MFIRRNSSPHKTCEEPERQYEIVGSLPPNSEASTKLPLHHQKDSGIDDASPRSALDDASDVIAGNRKRKSTCDLPLDGLSTDESDHHSVESNDERTESQNSPEQYYSVDLPPSTNLNGLKSANGTITIDLDHLKMLLGQQQLPSFPKFEQQHANNVHNTTVTSPSHSAVNFSPSDDSSSFGSSPPKRARCSSSFDTGESQFVFHDSANRRTPLNHSFTHGFESDESDAETNQQHLNIERLVLNMESDSEQESNSGYHQQQHSPDPSRTRHATPTSFSPKSSPASNHSSNILQPQLAAQHSREYSRSSRDLFDSSSGSECSPQHTTTYVDFIGSPKRKNAMENMRATASQMISCIEAFADPTESKTRTSTADCNSSTATTDDVQPVVKYQNEFAKFVSQNDGTLVGAGSSACTARGIAVQTNKRIVKAVVSVNCICCGVCMCIYLVYS